MQINVNDRITTDVAVVGGGTAGFFAALGAKNPGASVVLIEKNNILGGALTTPFVTRFIPWICTWQRTLKTRRTI